MISARRSLAVLLALGLCPPASPAQDAVPLAGSPNHVSAGRGLASGGSAASGPSYMAELRVGAPLSGLAAQSPSYTALAPTVSGADLTGPGAPAVFGISPDRGAAAGGDIVEIVGFHLAELGAGTPTVSMDGVSGGSVSVLSNTRVQVVTPAGIGAFGNPKGPVDVALTNGLGSASAQDAFTYTPAMRLGDEAEVGGQYRLQIVAEPFQVHLVYLGFSQPGVALPIAGFTGQLELITNVTFFRSGTTDANGDKSYTVFVPDKPSLGGVTFDFQTIAVELVPALAFAFTNRLPLTVHP